MVLEYWSLPLPKLPEIIPPLCLIIIMPYDTVQLLINFQFLFLRWLKID